jgi:uncharacterized protein involved in exopolysaccharide biosynthesis
MAAPADNQAVTFSERVFVRLLAAYPKAHREEYGTAMAQLFRDQCRDAWKESRGWGLARLWLRVLPDVIGTSLLEHLETIKERKFMLNRISTLFRSVQSFKFFTVFAAVFLLVVITATVVTFIMPESFVGTARINVQKESTGIQGMTGQNFNPSSVDPYFIQTEFEALQSQILLARVVENPKLNLDERWAAKNQRSEPLKTSETIVLLKQNLELRPIRNTSLIEIRYYSDKPEEAAEIANAIADAYKDYRLNRNNAKMEQGIKALKQEMDKQEKELHDAQVAVDTLRQELHVSDQDPQSTAPTVTLSSAVIQQLQADVIRMEAEQAKLEAQLSKLKPLPREKLRGTIQTVVEPDSVLTTLLSELDIAKQNRQKMQTTLTEDHPNFPSTTHQVEELNKIIDDLVDSIMVGLQTRLDSTKALIANLTNRMAAAKKTDIEIATRTHPYWDAKRKLQELLNFRSILQMKIASEEADMNLPKASSVEIIDRQTRPNFRPVRPNKPLNIALGVIVGIVLGLIAGGGVAAISFLIRRNAPPKIAA